MYGIFEQIQNMMNNSRGQQPRQPPGLQSAVMPPGFGQQPQQTDFQITTDQGLGAGMGFGQPPMPFPGVTPLPSVTNDMATPQPRPGQPAMPFTPGAPAVMPGMPNAQAPAVMPGSPGMTRPGQMLQPGIVPPGMTPPRMNQRPRAPMPMPMPRGGFVPRGR